MQHKSLIEHERTQASNTRKSLYTWRLSGILGHVAWNYQPQKISAPARPTQQLHVEVAAHWLLSLHDPQTDPDVTNVCMKNPLILFGFSTHGLLTPWGRLELWAADRGSSCPALLSSLWSCLDQSQQHKSAWHKHKKGVLCLLLKHLAAMMNVPDPVGWSTSLADINCTTPLPLAPGQIICKRYKWRLENQAVVRWVIADAEGTPLPATLLDQVFSIHLHAPCLLMWLHWWTVASKKSEVWPFYNGMLCANVGRTGRYKAPIGLRHWPSFWVSQCLRSTWRGPERGHGLTRTRGYTERRGWLVGSSKSSTVISSQAAAKRLKPDVEASAVLLSWSRAEQFRPRLKNQWTVHPSNPRCSLRQEVLSPGAALPANQLANLPFGSQD